MNEEMLAIPKAEWERLQAELERLRHQPEREGDPAEPFEGFVSYRRKRQAFEDRRTR